MKMRCPRQTRPPCLPPSSTCCLPIRLRHGDHRHLLLLLRAAGQGKQTSVSSDWLAWMVRYNIWIDDWENWVKSPVSQDTNGLKSWVKVVPQQQQVRLGRAGTAMLEERCLCLCRYSEMCTAPTCMHISRLNWHIFISLKNNHLHVGQYCSVKLDIQYSNRTSNLQYQTCWKMG